MPDRKTRIFCYRKTNFHVYKFSITCRKSENTRYLSPNLTAFECTYSMGHIYNPYIQRHVSYIDVINRIIVRNSNDFYNFDSEVLCYLDFILGNDPCKRGKNLISHLWDFSHFRAAIQ